jgi:hypothetical protein
MPMLHQPTLPEGYATIRRSKGRGEAKLRSSSASSIEMIEMSPRRKSTRFDSEVLYAKRSVVFDESSEDGVEVESDTKRTTFETFKPRNSIESGDDGSDKDLGQSSECFQSLPYDIIMSPLKSPQYINQLNAMRVKTPGESKFPLYARPDSPKYGKILYARSTSPDSMDNSSSNSSTYSSHTNSVFQHASMTQSLHLPSTQSESENVILINVNPTTPKKLNYRKSFSQFGDPTGHATIDAASTMSKSMYSPSTSSTSHLHTRQRFATLAHPRLDNKSSLSERNLMPWNPILSCKIGSQTTLRTKPPVPWYELAIKKEFRQSCPPLQVIIFHFIHLTIDS